VIAVPAGVAHRGGEPAGRFPQRSGRPGGGGAAGAAREHVCRRSLRVPSKRADQVKILAWDGTGLCLFQKRLENGRFVWPPVQNGAIRLNAAQLGLLLEGLDWSRVRPRPVIAPLLAG